MSQNSANNESDIITNANNNNNNNNNSHHDNENNCYQISDDDLDDGDDFQDDDADLIENVANASIENPQFQCSGRGPYERAWTTDATRALIHIRGPMEDRFSEGRQKRTALWLQCTKQLQRLGYRYSAAKVQKKWHNILITYNKNLNRKYLSGYVHWEFFDEMFKYLEGKNPILEMQRVPKMRLQQQQQQQQEPNKSQQHAMPKLKIKPQITGQQTESLCNTQPPLLQFQQQMLQQNQNLDTNSNDDEYDEDSTMSDLKAPKLEIDDSEPTEDFPLQINATSGFESIIGMAANNPAMSSANHLKSISNLKTSNMNSIHSTTESEQVWWQDYFERKLQVEREKVDLQREMHRDLMQFNKTSLVQQEKIERIKIDAINALTNTLQKLVESKNFKSSIGEQCKTLPNSVDKF